MPEAQKRSESNRPPPPSLLARHFLADELPEALRPTQDNHRLQVAVIWGGDRLIEVRDVVPGEEFTLGAQDSSLNVYQSLHSPKPVPFVRFEKDGTQRVFFPASATPTLHRGSGKLSFDQLEQMSGAERVDLPVKGVHYALGLNERASMKFGELQVVARYTRPESIMPRPLSERLDRPFLMALAILAFSACAVVGVVQRVKKPEVSLEDALIKNRSVLTGWVAPPAPVEKPKPKDNGAAPKAAGKEGLMGPKNKPIVEAAPKKTKEGMLQDKKTADFQKVQGVGLLAEMNRQGNAASKVMGNEGFTDGIEEAMNGVKSGAMVADSGGMNGLGVRGGHEGGGGNGPFKIGAINGDPNGRDPRGTGRSIGLGAFKKTDTVIIADKGQPMDNSYRDQIARVIRIHWNEIKYCYEKELQKNPNLDGKVAVSFDIGPTGGVTQASVREATLDSQDAQTCILSSVRRWAFPVPPTGVVQVNYPFLFSAAR